MRIPTARLSRRFAARGDGAPDTNNPGTSEWAALMLYGVTFVQTTTPLLTALDALAQTPKRAYDKQVMAHT